MTHSEIKKAMSHFFNFHREKKRTPRSKKKLEVRKNKYFEPGLSGLDPTVRPSVFFSWYFWVRDLDRNSDYGRHLVRGKFGPAKNADQKMDRLKNNGRVFRESLDRNITFKIFIRHSFTRWIRSC